MKRMRKKMTMTAFLAVLTGTFSAGAVNWLPTAAGTYSWGEPANWDGVCPTTNDTAAFGGTSLSGDQTVEMPDGSVAGCLDVNNGRNNNLHVRTFTGSLTTCSNVFRTGTTILNGRIDVTGSDQTYTRIGTSSDFGLMAILDVAEGGIFSATNTHAVVLGYNNNGSGTKAAGRLILREGGELYLGAGGNVSMNGLMLGRGNGASGPAVRHSSYFQEGGYARIARFICGFEKNGHTGMTIAGGVLELPHSTETRFRVGHLGYGIFQQLGGEIYVNTNKTVTGISESTPSESFEVGGAATSAAGRLPSSVYLCGGSFTCGDVFVIQGQANAGSEAASPPADLTVDGDADVTIPSIRMGVNRSSGAAVVNLNGGRLSTRYIKRASDGHLGPREVNGNGGTLCLANPDNPNTEHTYHFRYIDRVLLYPGGLTMQTDMSTKLGLEDEIRPLRTAKGYGVESVTLTTGLDNCYEPPLVTISGGSGSNATAIALIDYRNNRLTNVVVTCRGEGYAADDILTVSLLKDSDTPTAVTATVTLTPNTPGTLVKTGVNRLVLYDQPDFDGIYECRQGQLLQTTAGEYGSSNVAAIVVGGTNAVFQCGSGNATAVEAKWNPVNTNATLTLGTEHGPGQLTLPCGRDGKAFEQTFRSLTVNGTGNDIGIVADSATSAGVKLTLGTVTCAPGAQVTIPRWNSKMKVYVTGRPVGTWLRGVVFTGTDRFAMVGPDGQLIPATLGTILSIR